MSIFVEKRNGQPTGNLIVEVWVDGKPVRRRAKSKREANKLEASLKAGLVVAAKGREKPMTLGDLGPAVAVLWKGTKDEKNSLRRLGKALALLGLDKAVKDITTTDIDSLHKALRGEGLSDATINRYNAVVSKALEWAVERDHIAKLPKIQWYTEAVSKFSWLAPEDEQRVVEWMTTGTNVRGDVGHRCALVVQILTLTGFRIGELIRAKWDHVDPEAETVTAWDTKTGDSRTQYLPAELCRALRLMKRKGTFPSYQAFQGVFYRAREALGLDPKLTIHGLRHSTATRLALGGVNQRVIMEYMGHRSISTTNRYTHVNASAKKTAAQVLMGLTKGTESA